MVTREAIVAAARSFIGTPYHHQASCKKAGCDCLGLIRGVWRDVYGPEPEAPGQYHRSLSAKETMHEYPHLAHHRRLRQGRRTQVLGVTTALSAIALWGVGDMSLADLWASLRSRLAASVFPRLAPRSTTRRRRRRKEASPQRQNESLADLLLEHDPFRKAALTFPDHAFV